MANKAPPPKGQPLFKAYVQKPPAPSPRHAPSDLVPPPEPATAVPDQQPAIAPTLAIPKSADPPQLHAKKALVLPASGKDEEEDDGLDDDEKRACWANELALAKKMFEVPTFPQWKLDDMTYTNSHTHKAKLWVRVGQDGFYCRICQEGAQAAGTKGRVWVSKPCVNQYMDDAIDRHAKTSTHADYVSLLRSQGKSMPEHQEAANSQEVERLVKRFRDIYFLAKQVRPLNDFPDLLELEKFNGAYDETGGTTSTLFFFFLPLLHVNCLLRGN